MQITFTTPLAKIISVEARTSIYNSLFYTILCDISYFFRCLRFKKFIKCADLKNLLLLDEMDLLVFRNIPSSFKSRFYCRQKQGYFEYYKGNLLCQALCHKCRAYKTNLAFQPFLYCEVIFYIINIVKVCLSEN